jgi:hypothetical protein
MMAGLSQILTWPSPVAASILYVPYFGQMLPYTVPATPADIHRAPSVNLVAMLGPIGLLQHLWIIWEFLITG